MKLATAAEYLDLSASAFSDEVERGRLPKPVSFGGSDHWHRPAIDAALDAVFVDAPGERLSDYINHDTRRMPKKRPQVEPTRSEGMPYSVRLLAERWSCSEGLIHKLIKQDKLQSSRYGKLIRISATEVRRFEGTGEAAPDEWSDDDL